MSMIVLWLKKITLMAVITVASLGTMPLVNAYAQSANPPATPATSQPSPDKLQKTWAREQIIFNRTGKILDGANNLISKVQSRLEDAKAKGQDVSSIQSALDAFSAAVKNVQPIYTSMQTAVQSHPGFDATGKVTDPTQALQTIQDIHSKLESIHQSGLREAGKALREAIKEFRQANPSATPSPSTSSPNG